MALCSDSPNVTKAIWRNTNESLVEANQPALVDISTCNLHVIHNSFGKGVDVYGRDVEELAIDLLLGLDMRIKLPFKFCMQIHCIQVYGASLHRIVIVLQAMWHSSASFNCLCLAYSYLTIRNICKCSENVCHPFCASVG